MLTRPVGPVGLEEPVPAVQRQGRQGRRQDRRHLGRQQGRQAHRRSHGQPDRTADSAGPQRDRDTTGDIDETTRIARRRWPALARAAPARRRRSRPPTASPSTARCSRTATRPSCSRPRARSSGSSKRGPKNASLEQCDLGLGPGVVKGAYVADAALLRRHRAGAGPGDAPASPAWRRCRASRPPRSPRRPSASGEQANVDRAGHLDRGRVARHEVRPAAGARRRSARCYEIGKRAFFYRAGPHDFSCATCHGEDGKRIRLQDLPNLTKNPGDGIGFAAWPAYRVSSGEMWSMQWRLNDCFRQQRFPYPGFGSDVTIALGDLHGRQRQGRRVDRPGHQALKEPTA